MSKRLLDLIGQDSKRVSRSFARRERIQECDRDELEQSTNLNVATHAVRKPEIRRLLRKSRTRMAFIQTTMKRIWLRTIQKRRREPMLTENSILDAVMAPKRAAEASHFAAQDLLERVHAELRENGLAAEVLHSFERGEPCTHGGRTTKAFREGTMLVTAAMRRALGINGSTDGERGPVLEELSELLGMLRAGEIGVSSASAPAETSSVLPEAQFAKACEDRFPNEFLQSRTHADPILGKAKLFRRVRGSAALRRVLNYLPTEAHAIYLELKGGKARRDILSEHAVQGKLEECYELIRRVELALSLEN